MESQTENTLVSQVRIDIARIEGMLTQVLADHARRIEANDSDIKQLRIDLTAVKDNAIHEIATLSSRLDVGRDNIKTLQDSTAHIQTRMDNAMSKTFTFLSPIVSIGALLYTIFSQIKGLQ